MTLSGMFLVQYSELAEDYGASVLYGDVSPSELSYKMKTDSCISFAGSAKEAIERFRTEKCSAYRKTHRVLHAEVRKYLTVCLRSNHGKTSLEVKCIKKDYLNSVVLFIKEIDPFQYEEILHYLGSHVLFMYTLTNLGNTPCFSTFEKAREWMTENNSSKREM